MSCRLVRRHIGAFVDGELDPTSQIEFERHLAACSGCQELLSFERSFRGYVRDAFGGPSSKAPSHLHDRVRQALHSADADAAQHERAEGRRAALVRWLPMRARYTVPAAAAAAAALLVIGGLPLSVQTDDSIGQAGATPLLEDVVRLHSSQLPADVPGEQPDQVADYFRQKVGLAVEPVQFDRGDVRLTGGRVSSVRDRRAPAFYYDVHGRRVTVVVFDRPPEPVGLDAVRIRLGGRDLYYKQVRGYVVPVRRHGGLTYAFTGDLDRETLLHLAASSRFGR